MNGGDDDEVIIKYFYNLNYDDSRNEWFWWWWRDLMNDFDDDCQDCHSLNEWFWWWWQDDLDYNDRGEVRCWWGGGGGGDSYSVTKGTVLRGVARCGGRGLIRGDTL